MSDTSKPPFLRVNSSSLTSDSVEEEVQEIDTKGEVSDSLEPVTDPFLSDLESVMGEVEKAAEKTVQDALPDPLSALRSAMDANLCRSKIEQDLLQEALTCHTLADEWESKRSKELSDVVMHENSLENACVLFNGIGLLKNALDRELKAVKRVLRIVEFKLLNRFAKSSDERLVGMIVKCLDGKTHSFIPEIDDIPTIRKENYDTVTTWLKENNYYDRVSSIRWKFRELQKLVKELDEASVPLPEGFEVIAKMSIKTTTRKQTEF